MPPTVPITNLPEALGCCYVLLGAGFGARFIAPRLEQHLGPDTPLSFYRDGQPFLKPLWHQLDRLLAAHASEPAAREACANAARATFSLFFQNFQTISRPEHREVSTP
ncbi:hypothetical protein [Marinobacter persicus]|uniref:hypothetical protein n=1 Tax=Marinobacter persicus TaxID=930118 RepID=UPI001D128705|nr:hypothetical protein [Marinobacter persicus]